MAISTDGMSVEASVCTRFSWDYYASDEKLRALHEKAKSAQWNANRDIDWDQQIEIRIAVGWTD